MASEFCKVVFSTTILFIPPLLVTLTRQLMTFYNLGLGFLIKEHEQICPLNGNKGANICIAYTVFLAVYYLSFC